MKQVGFSSLAEGSWMKVRGCIGLRQQVMLERDGQKWLRSAMLGRSRSGFLLISGKWVLRFVSVWHYPWGHAVFREKSISLPWKTFVEQMPSTLNLSTELWYKPCNWLQQALVQLWLVSSYIELCHILAALQSNLNLVWVLLGCVYSNCQQSPR